MSMKPVVPVTLVLTTLNEARNVALFFDGVRAGSVLPAEISVCDGGSSDGTLDALRAQQVDGVTMRIAQAPGAGIARGRNTAIRAATHEILAITDAGCRIEPAWLERITAPLLADATVDAVSGGYTYAGDNLLQRMTAASAIPVDRQDPASFLPSSRSFAVRKTAILAAGLYREDLTFAGEDTALCLEMRRRGMRFVPRLDAKVHWFTRATLGAYIRQHYLYGLGDGEARSHPGRHVVNAAKLLLPLSLVPAPLLHPYFTAIPALLLGAYYLRLRRVYRWPEHGFGLSVGAFGLLFVKMAAMSAGWLRGMLRPMHGRTP